MASTIGVVPSVGEAIPARRRARTTSTRIRRPTSNCLPGSVRATIRRLTVSSSMLSTPISCGASNSSSSAPDPPSPSRRRPCSTSLTWLRSADVGTGMSMTARAQSLDRFTVLTIWPLGMVNISPSVERSLVTRSVTSSTVPSAGVDAGHRERYQVTEAVLLLGDDEESGQQVLHHALRAETERGAQHRGRRDERSDRDGEDVGDLASSPRRTAARPSPRRSPTPRPGGAWRSPCAPAGRFPDIRRRCAG